MKELPRPLVAVPIAALLAACAGGPKTKEALEQMSVAQLVAEMRSPSATQSGYWRYDPTYLDRIRQEWVRRNPDWPERTKQAVLSNQIHAGMTLDQVVAAWGSPTSSSDSTHGGLRLQTLVYNRGGAAWQSVTLTNGAVSGWTNMN